VYLGLDNEYQILRSEEFADRIEDLTEGGDVEVLTERDEIVTDIAESDESSSD